MGDRSVLLIGSWGFFPFLFVVWNRCSRCTAGVSDWFNLKRKFNSIIVMKSLKMLIPLLVGHSLMLLLLLLCTGE